MKATWIRTKKEGKKMGGGGGGDILCHPEQACMHLATSWQAFCTMHTGIGLDVHVM